MPSPRLSGKSADASDARTYRPLRVDGFGSTATSGRPYRCYCELCRAAFTTKTGIEDPPTETDDPNWLGGFSSLWIALKVRGALLRSRACLPSGRACVFQLAADLSSPGRARVPTDWISGDNSWVGEWTAAAASAFHLYPGQTVGYHALELLSVARDERHRLTLGVQAGADAATGSGRDVGLRGISRSTRTATSATVDSCLGASRSCARLRLRACPEDSLPGYRHHPQIAVLHSEHHLRRHMGRSLFDVDVAPVRGRRV